jgi:hypothetical protein
MRLVLVDVAMRKGRSSRAAMLKRCVLVERLGLCGFKARTTAR